MGLLDSVDFNMPLLRNPYVSEEMYFATSPNVAGMMTEDGKVILNPSLAGSARRSVYNNERARLHLKDNPPSFELTEDQKAMLENTTYANAADDYRKSTIAARLFSGDPSAGKPSFEQDAYVRRLRSLLGD